MSLNKKDFENLKLTRSMLVLNLIDRPDRILDALTIFCHKKGQAVAFLSFFFLRISFTNSPAKLEARFKA